MLPLLLLLITADIISPQHYSLDFSHLQHYICRVSRAGQYVMLLSVSEGITHSFLIATEQCLNTNACLKWFSQLLCSLKEVYLIFFLHRVYWKSQTAHYSQGFCFRYCLCLAIIGIIGTWESMGWFLFALMNPKTHAWNFLCK